MAAHLDDHADRVVKVGQGQPGRQDVEQGQLGFRREPCNQIGTFGVNLASANLALVNLASANLALVNLAIANLTLVNLESANLALLN